MNQNVQTVEQPKEASGLTLMNFKVGVIPLPLYLVLALIIFAASIYGKLPADMIGGFAFRMIMGIFLGDVGLKVPVLKDIGGPAILSIFVPSIMVFYNLINPSAMKAITALMKGSNFLYLYISCLVAGMMAVLLFRWMVLLP